MYPRMYAEQAVCTVEVCCGHFYIWSEQGPYPNGRIGEPIFTLLHHSRPFILRDARLPGQVSALCFRRAQALLFYSFPVVRCLKSNAACA